MNGEWGGGGELRLVSVARAAGGPAARLPEERLDGGAARAALSRLHVEGSRERSGREPQDGRLGRRAPLAPQPQGVRRRRPERRAAHVLAHRSRARHARGRRRARRRRRRWRSGAGGDTSTSFMRRLWKMSTSRSTASELHALDRATPSGGGGGLGLGIGLALGRREASHHEGLVSLFVAHSALLTAQPSRIQRVRTVSTARELSYFSLHGYVSSSMSIEARIALAI